MVVDRSLHQLTCEAKVHKSLKHPCLQTIQCTNSSLRHVWKARPFSSFLGWQVEASSTTTLETSHNASLVNIVMEVAASQGLNPPPIKVWSRRVPLFVLQCFFWHLKRRLFWNVAYTIYLEVVVLGEVVENKLPSKSTNKILFQERT